MTCAWKKFIFKHSIAFERILTSIWKTQRKNDLKSASTCDGSLKSTRNENEWKYREYFYSDQFVSESIDACTLSTEKF